VHLTCVIMGLFFSHVSQILLIKSGHLYSK
jgi:hypothetical protein